MLILPLHRKPTRENLPVLTVLLVLANALVFAIFQSNDDVVEEQAAQRYVETGVLEQEWAWFHEWADMTHSDKAQPDQLDAILPEVGEHFQADYIRLMSIERQPAFLQAVDNEWFVSAESGAYRQWEEARERLEKDREESFTRRYMLGYDEVKTSTLFTHMFMHGGLIHLIGNMVFLVLLGILLEPALGALRLLITYVVGGLCAAGVSLAVHWGADNGMVGASGAIAGLMGLLALVYGMRRIRFFYWAFVYFDYVRAPALVLLPMWLGWEVVAFLINDGSNVAYEAHIGGIVSGALIGLLLVRTDQVREDWLDETANENSLDRDREIVRAARAALDELDADEAKRLLGPLLARHGQDQELLRLYLAACQLRNNDADLHDAARRIFELPGDSPDERRLVVEVFNRYLEATGGRLRIRAKLAVGLAGRFVNWSRFDEARTLIDRMARLGKPVPGLAALCIQLADKLRGVGDTPELEEHYRRLAESMPDSV
ncbi:MAG: rhomboid family intramembrane serine protease [Wenzhouxiangellaceae bacterium]